jgi:hypothetical protein
MADDAAEPEIIIQIARAVMAAPPAVVKRLRFAVSPQEYQQIRQCCFARDGHFFSAIRGCPLLVEEHPDYPLYSFETMPTEAA